MSEELFFDTEGNLTNRFETVLSEVFVKYAKSLSGKAESKAEATLDTLYDKKSDLVMGEEELDAFFVVTNGEHMSADTKDEIFKYFDVREIDDKEFLTFSGFVETYTLQTENEIEETVKDLKTWGYDGKLVKINSEEETSAKEEKNAEHGEKDRENSSTQENTSGKETSDGYN